MVRVLIVTNRSILGEALEKLLARETDLVVKSVMPVSEDDVKQAIDNFRPSVTIIEDRLLCINLIGRDLLWSGTGSLRFITVSSEKNEVEIIEICRVPLSGLKDLVKQVRSIRKNPSVRIT